MVMGSDSLRWIFIIFLTFLHLAHAFSSVCQLSFTHHNTLYNYSLAAPLAKYPHGVLSEDGFYKVAVNNTVLWFQLCDRMIFNHDPPRCVDCSNCGGSSHYGLECSALVANNIGGYPVCTALGRVSDTNINIMDQQNPHKGVIVKMSRNGPSSKYNCSLTVSVICDSNGVQGPQAVEILGTCDYAVEMWHPAGCAMILSVDGRGWGWFGTFTTIVLCLLGSYLLAGTAYRYVILGVRGVNVIPNLDTWTSLPHRTQSFFTSLVRKFRGPSEGYRDSYSRVNF